MNFKRPWHSCVCFVLIIKKVRLIYSSATRSYWNSLLPPPPSLQQFLSYKNLHSRELFASAYKEGWMRPRCASSKSVKHLKEVTSSVVVFFSSSCYWHLSHLSGLWQRWFQIAHARQNIRYISFWSQNSNF